MNNNQNNYNNAPIVNTLSGVTGNNILQNTYNTIKEIEPNKQPKKENKALKILSRILIFVFWTLLLGFVGLSAYAIIMNLNSMIIDSVIDTMYTKTDYLFDKVYNFSHFNIGEDILDNTGNIDLSLSSNGEEENYNLTYDLIINAMKNEFSLEASILDSDSTSKLITFNTMGKDGNTYLKSGDLSSKTYHTSFYNSLGISLGFDDTDFTYDDYKLFLNKLFVYLKDNIKSDYVSFEVNKYNVDGKVIYGKKTSIKFNQKRLCELYINILTSFKNDTEVADILKRVYNKSNDEIRNDFNDKIDELNKKYDEYFDEEESLSINLYSNIFGNIEAFEVDINCTEFTILGLDGEYVLYGKVNKGIINVNLYNKTFENNKYTLNLLGSASITSNKLDIEIINDDDKYKFGLEDISNGFKISCKVLDYSGEFEFTSDFSNDVAKNTIKLEFKNGSEFKLSINVDNETKKTESIKEMDVTGAIDISEIANDTELIENYNNKFKGTIIDGYISSLLSSDDEEVIVEDVDDDFLENETE